MVRNSILTGCGDSISGCGSLTFVTNAVDSTGFGGSNDDVGSVMAGWFADLAANDYHLTAAGETIFMDIESWQEGDPTTDFDGIRSLRTWPAFLGTTRHD